MSTSYGLYQSTVTYGSGDSDVVQLDQYTGRMTQYKFNVGSQNVTGNLTWNSNGSLGTLGITNQLNSLDTQTCSYMHDDLSRISSTGCVNGSTNRWNQNFAYDAFGNISKTVPTGGTGIAFPGYPPSQGYSSSTNQLLQISGCAPPTYDNNGQLTNDCAHTYTWDAEHKMHSVDASPASCSTSGECLTYDALGRMVEKTVGSTYTQIVYGPQGRFATMNGQTTVVSAFIPLPGSQAVYTGASLLTSNKVAYYRHTDHLGSSRLATTPAQTLYSSTAYAPFGEPYSQSGVTDLSFTGQEQDTVSGIHDFPARKYPPVQGRWLSPDPGGLAAANPANPQSWNRYAYVLNNPLSMVDPLGLAGCPGEISGGCESDPSHGYGCDSWCASGQADLGATTGSGGTGNGGCDGFCMMDGGDVIYKDTNTERNVTIQDWFNSSWSPWDYEYEGNYFDNTNDLLAFVEKEKEEAEDASKDTAGCIATAIRSKFPGSTATTGSFIDEEGGHDNFNVQIQFSSYTAAAQFSGTYAAAMGSGSFAPPARFGSGPALHLENVGAWSSSNGTYSIGATGHIDLFNPNSTSLGGGGTDGLLGHVFVDGLWGHIVQAFGGNIDPRSCPF